MGQALFIGLLVVMVSIILAAGVFQFAIYGYLRVQKVARRRRLLRRGLVAVIYTMAWVVIVLAISVALWTTVLLRLGLFTEVEAALYYSLSSFTTVGYGDVILPGPWRILGAICAANGLLIFGLFTAFIVEILDFRLKR